MRKQINFQSHESLRGTPSPACNRLLAFSVTPSNGDTPLCMNFCQRQSCLAEKLTLQFLSRNFKSRQLITTVKLKVVSLKIIRGVLPSLRAHDKWHRIKFDKLRRSNPQHVVAQSLPTRGTPALSPRLSSFRIFTSRCSTDVKLSVDVTLLMVRLILRST